MDSKMSVTAIQAWQTSNGVLCKTEADAIEMDAEMKLREQLHNALDDSRLGNSDVYSVLFNLDQREWKDAVERPLLTHQSIWRGGRLAKNGNVIAPIVEIMFCEYAINFEPPYCKNDPLPIPANSYVAAHLYRGGRTISVCSESEIQKIIDIVEEGNVNKWIKIRREKLVLLKDVADLVNSLEMRGAEKKYLLGRKKTAPGDITADLVKESDLDKIGEIIRLLKVAKSPTEPLKLAEELKRELQKLQGRGKHWRKIRHKDMK
jgi:hypothetical protein